MTLHRQDEAGITERQEQFLAIVRTFSDLHGYAPSVREIGERMGIQSPNGVVGHIRALVRKGLLTWNPKTARSLRVVDADRIAVSRNLLERALHECLDGQSARTIAILEELLSLDVDAPNGQANVRKGEHRS